MPQKETKMTNKNGLRAALIADKTTPPANQKHSAPFYISNTLFDNKRLKQLRCQWADALKVEKRRKKTENRKKRLARLKADVTIELLSDEDVDPRDELKTQSQDEEQKRESQSNPLANLSLYNGSEGSLQISHVFDVTNISMLGMLSESFEPKQRKKRRKIKMQKPTVFAASTSCTESVVVIDDDDDDGEEKGVESTIRQNHTTSSLSEVSHFPSPPHSSPKLTKKQKSYTHDIILIDDDADEGVGNTTHTPTTSLCTQQAPTVFTEVDEEVSVSLVSRSKTNGNCSSDSNAKTLFPMQPDETTVHTVIANRSYELSLTKLREGLATCGVPEFSADDKNSGTVTSRRKGNFAPPVITPPPAPISLKLSSDLSISLISDEEPEESEDLQNHASPGLRTVHAMILPEISLKPLALPQTMEKNNHQTPKKLKLG